MAVFSGFVFGRCLYVFGCFHVFRMMFSCQCSVSDGRWIVPPPLRMDDLCGFAKSVPVTVVHCERGANRSPAVAAVILALAKGCTFEEAVPWLKNQLLLKGLKP